MWHAPTRHCTSSHPARPWPFATVHALNTPRRHCVERLQPALRPRQRLQPSHTPRAMPWRDFPWADMNEAWTLLLSTRTGMLGPVSGESPARYDELTSHAAACSADAYIEPVREGALLISDPMTDAQAVVSFSAERHNHVVATVAFRGMSSVADAYVGLWFPLRSLPSPHRQSVKAHHGALLQYLSIHAHILAALEASGATHVVLTGHSLGGALAVVAAAMLPDTYTYDLVTFGGPRAGNTELADAVYPKCRSVVRVVHNRDIVPCMPLEVMGFKHVSKAWVFLDAEQRIHRVPAEFGFLRQCLLRIQGLVQRRYGLRDHFMSNYTVAVRDADTVTSLTEPRRAALEGQVCPHEKVDEH